VTTMIQTVRGPVALEQLGQTMMHEHVFADYRPQFRDKNLAFAKQELQKLVDCGARTLVDVGPWPGRDMTLYQELAPQLNLNIVLSTGFYLMFSVPEPLRSQSEDEYVERFTKELIEGIGDSGLRAGVIKVGSAKAQLSDWEKKLMRAAARVQRETGVPICTHAVEGARSQFDALTRAGADPERIYMSHIEAEFGWEGRNLREELEYLTAIARDGGSLFFNNFALWTDTPPQDLAYLIHTLCDRGYEHRVLFGIDANFHFDDEGHVWWEDEQRLPETGCRSFSYTYTGAIPFLRKWGFTDEQFRIFLEENPKRLFRTTRI